MTAQPKARPKSLSSSPLAVAITGGTGAYRDAGGSMDLKYRNPAGTEFDFVFNLHGPGKHGDRH